jgi:hypothetical protein
VREAVRQSITGGCEAAIREGFVLVEEFRSRLNPQFLSAQVTDVASATPARRNHPQTPLSFMANTIAPMMQARLQTFEARANKGPFIASPV